MAEEEKLTDDEEYLQEFEKALAQLGDPQQNIDPEPFAEPDENSPRRVVLDQMGIEDKQDYWLFVADLVGFTCESTARPGDYQNTRGYWNVQLPLPHKLRVPIHDPHKKVTDESGNLGLYAAAFFQIASTLDAQVVDVANQRLDREVVAADQKAATQVRPRVDAGKEVRQQQKEESI